MVNDASIFFFSLTLAEVSLEIWGCGITIYRKAFILSLLLTNLKLGP